MTEHLIPGRQLRRLLADEQNRAELLYAHRQIGNPAHAAPLRAVAVAQGVKPPVRYSPSEPA